MEFNTIGNVSNDDATYSCMAIIQTHGRTIPLSGLLVWFILRPCQHDDGYIDGRLQIIKVHERTQVHSVKRVDEYWRSDVAVGDLFQICDLCSTTSAS